MTITRDQIVELLTSNVGCDCDVSFGEVVGTVEAAEVILALIEKERDPLIEERIKDIEQALEEIRWIINDDPAGRKLAKIERVLDRVIPLDED